MQQTTTTTSRTAIPAESTTCLNCGRGDCSTRRKQHPFEYCQRWTPSVPSVESVPSVPAQISKRGLPVNVQGTWEGARTWLEYARKFEQCKLYSQVMVGFELVEIRRKLPNESGKRSDMEPRANVGTRWEEALEKELNIPRRSAYRYMEMAKAAAPRLRKMVSAGELDLLQTPISQLPEPKQKLLAAAVKKITDGKTQLEFAEELGLYKKEKADKPGNKTGTGGRPPGPVTPEDVRAARLKMMREDRQALLTTLQAHGPKCIHAEDEDQLPYKALMAALEKQLKALHLWFDAPPAKRDADLAKKIEALFQ